MKKWFLAATFCLFITGFLSAQAYEGTLKVKKLEEPAIVMVYKYPADVVENAFKAKLADKRLKGNKSRGFLVYNNSQLTEIAAAPLDYSFKFDESGKRGNESTTVYLLMKGDNSAARDGATMARNAKSFLENMLPAVQQSNTIAQIKRQEDMLVKEEKQLLELKKDHEALDKKIQDNEKQQAAQEKVIESQRSILADLKSKLN